MKLHLPIGLRKALMAVLAILPTASVAVSVAYAVEPIAAVDLTPEEKSAIVTKVSEYNQTVANAAYSTTFGETYSDAYDVNNKESKYNTALAGYAQTAKDNAETDTLKAQLIIGKAESKYQTEYDTVYSQYDSGREAAYNQAYEKFKNEANPDDYAQQGFEYAKKVDFTGTLKKYNSYEEVPSWLRGAIDKGISYVIDEAAKAAGKAAEVALGQDAASKAACDLYLEDVYGKALDNLDNQNAAKQDCYDYAVGQATEAVKNAAYIYSETYGSEVTVTYEDGKGNTQTVIVNTACGSGTQLGLNKDSSEKIYLDEMTLKDGNLVLDKESYYKLDTSNQTSSEVQHEDHTHNVLSTAEVQYRVSDYILDETVDLGEGKVITEKQANTVTVGTDEKSGGLKAADVAIDALSNITVQNGSYIEATDGNVALNSTLGAITVTGIGSVVDGKNVILNGKDVVLSDGAQLFSTGAASSLPTDELETVAEITDYDIQLTAQNALTITGAAKVTDTISLPTSVSGKDVLLSSAGSIIIDDAAQIAANNSVTVKDTGSLTISDGAKINVAQDKATAVDVKVNGNITVSDASIGSEGWSHISLVSTAGDVSISGEIYAKERKTHTQILGKTVTVSGNNVTWDGGTIHSCGPNGSYEGAFSMTAAGKLLIMDGAEFYGRGSAELQGADVIINGAYFNAQYATVNVTATSGDIVLNGAPTNDEYTQYGITNHDGYYNSTKFITEKAISLTANQGDITLKAASLSSGKYAITLNAGGVIDLLNGTSITGAAFKASGDTFTMSGTEASLTAKGFSDKNVQTVGNVILEFANGISISDGAKLSVADNISMTTTNGDITISSANSNLVTQNGSVYLSAGNNINLSNIATSAKDDVTMIATGGSISTDGGVTSTEGAVYLSAGKGITLSDIATAQGNVTMIAAGGGITIGGDVTSSEGAVSLTSKNDLSLTGATSGKLGVALTSTAGKVSTSGNVSAANGNVILNAAKEVSLNGSQVEAGGNVLLNGFYTNNITGGTVEAGGNVEMTGGVESISLSAVQALGNLTTNTVSGVTIEADGAFNMTGLKLETEEKVEGGEPIVNLYTVGSNVISDGATVNAGSVKLDGLNNTISGKYVKVTGEDGNEHTELDTLTSVTGVGNVVLGEAGLTLINTVKGANVTSTGGDIVLTGQLNTIDKDATLYSTAGSILLNGSTAEGVQEIVGVLDKLSSTPLVGGIFDGLINKILPEGTNFDFTLNNVNGNMVAGKSISLDSTVNLLSGGEWKATDGVSYTLEDGQAPELRAITVDGAVNVLTGSKLIAENGNINLIANESIADGLAESLISLAGKYITIPESLTSVVGMLDMGGVNVMTGGSLDAKNGSILLDSTANVITGGTVNASGVVTLDGTINTVTGGSINGGSVVLNAKDGELNLSEIIGGIVDSLSKDDSEQGTGDEIVDNDETLTEEDENQVTITGGANSLMGGEITGGDVTLAATANLVTNGSITADNSVKFDGAINAVTGGTITGGSVDFFASEGNTLDLTGLLDSLSGVLGGNKQDGSTDADGNPTVGEGQMNWTDVIGYLGDALSGNTNLVIGGEVKATSGDVTMDGTLNVLTGGTVSAEQGTVQLTGLANVLVGGTVNNSNAAELNGSINAVLSGTLEGGSVTMNGAKDGLNLGEVLVPVLGSAGVDSSITDLVGKLGTINGNINLVTGGTVNATSGNATMNGTLNLLTGGSVNATDTATLNGAANVLVGGELSGANVVMQQGATGINLGGVIKPLLESAGVGAEITDLVGNLGEINGNINVVIGNAVVNGTNSVKMDALANVVMGEGAQVTGGKVTLTGTQSIDLPLGTIINGLASQYVELPEAVTGVLGSLDGKIGLNTNVIIDGGSVSATDKAVIDASVNYIGNGGSVSGANLVQLYGPMNLVLSNGSLTSENGTVRMNGYGPSLNELGVQIPAEYADYANKLGLSGLLNKQFGVNLVMGEGATVTGKAVELNAGLMNMVADRAQLTADNNMTLSGATNIVVDGSTLTAGGTLSMSGSLNLVSHLVLNDFVNAIQNGTPLPTDGALTTLSGQDVQLWGAANVLHGNVLVTATGDVVMAGMGEPLFELSTMTVQQVVDLARELGVPALLDEAKTEVLNALMDYAAENNMSDLVEAAAALGLKDQLSGIYSDLKDFVKEHGDATLNLSFNGNVNTVSGCAMVNGNNVNMSGTINYVGDLASVTGNTVKIDGITNVVAGGAEVTGGDITLSGGVNVLVDTTLDNVKDAIANGNLDSIIAGGKDLTTVSGNNVTLDAEANLINGYVAVTADNTVTMQGITNVVSGGATVSGKGSVNMDAVANVIAGGASVSGGDINMTGGMNAVVDTTLGNVVDALQQQSLAPLMQGGSEQTTLTATGDINLGAALNVVNGGKVVLEAGDAVNMTGAVNVLGSKTTVNATDINMAGMEVPELDLSGILPAEYNDLANEFIEEGLNLSVVAGGAKLTAKNDITLSGVASAVVDTSMTNVLDALKQQSIDPLLKGGNIETVLTAGNDINLISKLNVVNGGKVTLEAGNDVTMAGVLNVVNGNNVVTAGNAINMDAAANLVSGGAYLNAQNVSIGGNAALSDEFAALIESVIPGVELPSGVSAGVVMGNGTSVNAGNRVEMLSNVNVVADSAEINAKTARLAGTLNAVATDAAVSADKVDMLGTVGNLVLDGATVAAEGNATMTGAANVVQGATVTAETGNINMEALGAVSNGLSEVVDKLLPDAATAERVNNLLAQGNANAVVDGAQLNAAGNVSMKAAANVVDNSTVSAGGNVAMSSSALHTINNSTIQSVSGNVSISGGIATVTGSTVTAEQGRINFSDVNIAMSGGSMYAADGMTVANGSHAALSDVMLGGESFIESGSSLNISNLESMGDIENFGSLSLENAVLSGGTLYNAGSISVSGELTLQSTTLVFVVDSLTQNSTAIALSGESTVLSMVSTYSRSGLADGIAGVNFVITSDMLNSINNGQEFKLDIFTGATDEEYSMLAQAIQNHEISFTLNNGYNVEVTDVGMVFNGGVVSLTGTATVPEPTTATLSLLALVALAARRRRQK